MTELWFPVPRLAGDVVLLRPWRDADVPGMVAAFSEPVMQRFSWRTTPYTETDARDYLAEAEEARLRGDALHFALTGPHDQDVVLGSVSLQEVRLDQGCAAVGYWLAPGARGRGAATPAVRLLARCPKRSSRVGVTEGLTVRTRAGAKEIAISQCEKMNGGDLGSGAHGERIDGVHHRKQRFLAPGED